MNLKLNKNTDENNYRKQNSDNFKADMKKVEKRSDCFLTKSKY